MKTVNEIKMEQVKAIEKEIAELDTEREIMLNVMATSSALLSEYCTFSTENINKRGDLMVELKDLLK